MSTKKDDMIISFLCEIMKMHSDILNKMKNDSDNEVNMENIKENINVDNNIYI